MKHTETQVLRGMHENNITSTFLIVRLQNTFEDTTTIKAKMDKMKSTDSLRETRNMHVRGTHILGQSFLQRWESE